MARTMHRNGASLLNRNNHKRQGSNVGEKKEIWSTLLDNVASGKRLPEKNLLVLGGTQESQREFIDSLSQDQQSRAKPSDRSKNRRIPIANQFALGYTYQSIYDSEHEDMLARLSIYTLDEPSPAYATLLARLLTPETIPHTAIAILLDWAEPWKFLRILQAWIRLLKTVIGSLPSDSEAALEGNSTTWQRSKDAEASTSVTDSHTVLPLGPGELDEPLGLPLVVVCQNAIAVEQLEKERGYRESNFDYILQFLRTVLLKHGSGLIYTMPSQPGQLQPLIHTILNISSGLSGSRPTGREKVERGLKHNVVDRERVMVPPGWDSWGKIRILREGFDVEGISRAWGVEIQPSYAAFIRPSIETDGETDATEEEARSKHGEDESETQLLDPDSTVALYEAEIQDPRPPNTSRPGIEVDHTPDQTFLAAQLERLESYRAEDEGSKKVRERDGQPAASRRTATSDDGGRAMQDAIGPVQFNMGGIQYDAEDAVRRIKERARPQATPERSRTRESTPFTPNSPPQLGEGKEFPTENLEAYFASLMKGGRAGSGGSVSNSPRPSQSRESRGTS